MSSFFRNMFIRDKEPKTPSSAVDMTKSMIDFISDDLSPNTSFQDHTSDLNNSFSIFKEERRNVSDKTQSEPDLAFKRPRLNISSVLNTPKRGSLMEDLYEIVQEQVIDQVGEMLQPSKKAVLSPTLFKSVQQKDFDLYIARLRKVYDVYKKNNSIRTRLKQKEQINMAASLVKCYDLVPHQYFDEGFMFNFEYLTKDKSMIMKAQEELSESLDLVEVNLYHQVTSRFEEYLDVLLKINQLENQIQTSLYSIKFFKNFNLELRNKFSGKVQGVLRVNRRKLNIEKTLGLIDLINVVKKTLPTLIHLIKKNNFESAVKLVKTSEEAFKTKLKQVKALKNFNANFGEARSTLEKLLTTEFEDRCINYLTPAFSYSKGTPASLPDDVPLVEENFLDIITGDFNDADEIPSTNNDSLYWNLNTFPSSDSTEQNISKIIVEYIKIKDFPLSVYKGKLLEVMKRFHKKFMSDVSEYIDSLPGHQNSKGQNNSSQKNMPFDLYLKFILFYFEIFKRFLTRHFNLNHKILSSLVAYYNSNFVEKSNQSNGGYSFLPVLDNKSMKDLNETVQEFYLTLAMIFKYFNDRLAEVINLRSTDNISVKQFTKLVTVFEYITNYFQGTLQIDEKLNSWIVSDKEGIKKPLLRLVSSLSDKITLSPTQTLIIEIERNFINQHHKKQLEALKASLEQETWQAVEIPKEYNAYFSIFFELPKQQKQHNGEAKPQILDVSKTNTEESTNIDEASSQGQVSERKIEEAEEKKEENIHFNINKTEIIIDGNKFQVTSSFLLLIQNIYDYFQLAIRFKIIGLDAMSKIFEMMKFYNSYAIQLILGAGATTFGKIPRITAKILGISSISLCLLVHLIDPLYKNILKQDPKINNEWLHSEVSKVTNDLTNHINEIGSKIRSILKSKLIEQSNELKKLNWASVQEKITTPTKYTTSILTNNKQMYKQIQAYLLREQLIFIAKGILEDIKVCFLPVFEGINVESRISAKRIKDELQHFNDELYQIPIFQDPGVNYSEFEDKVLSVIEDKCNHFLDITSIN